MHLRGRRRANHLGDSATFDVVNPAIPPSAPVLAATTDSGTSNADGITNFNNSSSPRLAVHRRGTVRGATVTIYSDGATIGSAVATGASTTVTANGSTILADGVALHHRKADHPRTAQTVDSPAKEYHDPDRDAGRAAGS